MKALLMRDLPLAWAANDAGLDLAALSDDEFAALTARLEANAPALGFNGAARAAVAEVMSA